MKRLFVSIVVAFAVMVGSCKAPRYAMGMSEFAFLANNKVETIEQSQHISVYKKVNYPFGAPAVTKFFYFKDGKLVEVNEGERTPDVIIENRNK
jgi:hypothetical protein